MLTLGWKELVCVAVYTALVWTGHALLRLAYPMAKPAAPARRQPRSWLLPAAVFILGGVLGALFVLPAASGESRWDAVLGPGLILLTGPLTYRAARSGLTILHGPALTPCLMAVAALATASRGVFNMTLVFLPMCVAAMGGIGIAELVAAHSIGQPLTFSRIGGWGLRLIVESVLGSLIAAAAIVLLR